MPIYQKINQVMKAVRGVERASTNTHAKYSFAGHDAVTAALRVEFAKLGIVRSVDMLECDVLDGGAVKVKVSVAYTDIEDSTKVVCEMFALQHSQTSKGGITAQQVGQALSYAVKNVEFKLFALTGDPHGDSDDDDPEPVPEPAPLCPDMARDRATELLTMVGATCNKAELEELMTVARAEWADLKQVPGFVEAIKAQRENALVRIGK